MENFTDVKLEIFVPQEYALKIRDELANIGVGRIGNSDHCIAMSSVQGYYRPLPGADPFEGNIEKISEVKMFNVENKVGVKLMSSRWRATSAQAGTMKPACPG